MVTLVTTFYGNAGKKFHLFSINRTRVFLNVLQNRQPCSYLIQFCTMLQNTSKKTESVLETHEHLSYSQHLSTGKITLAVLSYKQS